VDGLVDVERALAPFRDHPELALVATDFDGTLSPIVEDPAVAAPLDGIPDLLADLAGHVGEVAVISGRPLDFLDRWFPHPSAVTLVGLYGLEVRRRGVRDDHPTSGVWRETMADVAGLARLQGPADMDVELKGLSITLHYRRHPEIAPQVERWAELIARPAGIRVRAAKKSVELHPPIDEDKGTVLHRLASDLDGPVLFAGDDLGDVPAFEYLGALRAAGRAVLRVAVDGPEVPTELTDLADLVVDGPAEVARLLERLR
jgi:trehalose 6-phosphate phosphatase